MFYQHELLSKQKSGLGLVWLLSTIGAKASFGKRVSKKDLLKGDVSKVCQTVIDPPEPLALRLSASLLLGTARLFGQQVTLFHGDVERVSQALRKAIIDMSKANATNLDMAMSTARKDAITMAAPDVELGLDIGMDFNMDDFAILLFDEQMARPEGTIQEEEEVGFTTQDLFVPDDEQDACIPPGSSKKKKGKQRAVEQAPPSQSKRPDNTLDDNELNLLQENFDFPFVDPADLSAQQDYAMFMDGAGDQPFFAELGAELDFLAPDLDRSTTRHSRTAGSNNAGGFDLNLDLDFPMDLNQPPAGRRSQSGDLFGQGQTQGPEADVVNPMDLDLPDPDTNFFDQMDIDPAGPATPQQQEEEAEVERTPSKTTKKPKKKAKAKPKAAILDKNVSLKDQDFASARAAYSEMLKGQNDEIEAKTLEKTEAERARAMIFDVPAMFQTDNDLTDLWNTMGPKFRKRADETPAETKRKRARKNKDVTPAPEEEAETGRDQAHDFGVDGYMPDFDPHAQDYNQGPSQSQEVELGRAASRAGSVGPYKGDETMPWNVMDPAPPSASRGDTSHASGRHSFRGETPVSARQRSNSRQGSVFGSPALLARSQSRRGSITGHESLDRNLDFNMDAFETGQPLEGEGFTFEESDLSQAAQDAKLQQESINFLTFVKKQTRRVDGQLLFSDLCPITVTAQKVAAQAFYHVLVLASKSLISIEHSDEAGEIHLSIE